MAAVALDIHLEDGRVVDETVDRRERHGLVRENLRPVGKGLVGGDQQGAAFVAGRDELEQNAGLRLVLADVGEVMKDEEVILVEPGDGCLELEVASSGFKLRRSAGVSPVFNFGQTASV